MAYDKKTQLAYRYRYLVKAYARLEDYGEYIYAEPTEYAHGHTIGDCWIVNARGEIHPNYSVCPTPFNVNDLENPRKVTIPRYYSCDTCGASMSAYLYRKGQGLCPTCVDAMQ